MKTKEEIRNKIFQGNCLDVLKDFPGNCISSVITDPPYGLSQVAPDMREVLKCWISGEDYDSHVSGFMSKDWDSFVPGPKIWKEVMRVLKPGGHIFSFSGGRTYDLMVTAMRLAGSEIRDKFAYICEQEDGMSWIRGQNFPKSLDIGKTTKDTSWDGYGTALKSLHEPIAVFGKDTDPLEPDVPFKYQGKASEKERNLGCENLYWLTGSDGKTASITAEYFKALSDDNESNKNDHGYHEHLISNGNIHNVIKPLQLIRYLVKMVKMPGDNLILDPFCGSGTTLVACVLEGCGFVGIDMESLSVDISMRG